jgi:hypothetical protein
MILIVIQFFLLSSRINYIAIYSVVCFFYPKKVDSALYHTGTSVLSCSREQEASYQNTTLQNVRLHF